MSTEAPGTSGADAWARALRAAELLAVDPQGLGGISLRARAGPVRDLWLAELRRVLPRAPFRRLPLNITDDRLLGGLDLAATLKAHRPIAETGLLAAVDGGALVIPSAERVPPALVARITQTLDTGRVAVERDGFTLLEPACFAVVALDESVERDECLPAGLLDRLAMHIVLDGISVRETFAGAVSERAFSKARAGVGAVRVTGEAAAAIAEAAAKLGIGSLRAPLLALRLARAAAALAGRDEVCASDLEEAASLVLAPRAVMLPDALPPNQEPQEQGPDESATSVEDDTSEPTPEELAELILAAAQAAIPEKLLERLKHERKDRRAEAGQGRSGVEQAGQSRGRPAGVRPGRPQAGARLNVVATLRAAAPWQPLRRSARVGESTAARRIEVRQDDFRISRRKHHAQTTTIFVVDASGSSALHRLAEAKGAVELLLADCYVRRDQVALVAFRGTSAEILLEPTRSLVRAKRCLSALPGGGGTPVATGIERALVLGLGAKRKGRIPQIVLLTDGRANIDRNGRPGRARAEQDALSAAGELKASGITSLVIDTSPKHQAQAESLARALGATYLPLPYANAVSVSEAVRAATS